MNSRLRLQILVTSIGVVLLVAGLFWRWMAPELWTMLVIWPVLFSNYWIAQPEVPEGSPRDRVMTLYWGSMLFLGATLIGVILLVAGVLQWKAALGGIVTAWIFVIAHRAWKKAAQPSVSAPG